MKLSIEPTNEIQTVDGVPHRIWKGVSDSGTPVCCAIRFVQPQTHDKNQLAVFERELEELPKPVADGFTVGLRFIV